MFGATPPSLNGVPAGTRGHCKLNLRPIFNPQAAVRCADSQDETRITALRAPHAAFGEGTIVKLRSALCIAAFLVTLAPAMAQDPLRSLAPADEYFGRSNLSVLAIANALRDAGLRLGSGGDPRTVLSGPLSFVSDAVKDWERKYPADPWIAKDLAALEGLFLQVHTDEGFRLAERTQAWLAADYPNSPYAAKGRDQLAVSRAPDKPKPQEKIPSYATPWERFAALRVPPPPR